MFISASFLGIQDHKKEKILKLGETSDFLHIDVMDGEFVYNQTESLEELKKIIPLSKPSDVHLMVRDVSKYIEEYANILPEYITIHVESNGVLKGIDLIKSKNIKVGLAIKPSTPLSRIIPYLPIIDLVLVMSVEPGRSGQKFIQSTVNKINELKRIREIHNYHYLIEVDGGINDRTALNCKSADILVSGSYITNSNRYEERIELLKKVCN